MVSQSPTFSITYASKKGNSAIAELPFASMKDMVVGTSYELSLVIASKETMRTLNRTYRQKDCATDILSFPFDASHGEIFINLEETKKEAKKFGREFKNFVGFLFIHGLVHLKGFKHGSTMEREERKVRKLFGV